jgi:hypothetical protein
MNDKNENKKEWKIKQDLRDGRTARPSKSGRPSRGRKKRVKSNRDGHEKTTAIRCKRPVKKTYRHPADHATKVEALSLWEGKWECDIIESLVADAHKHSHGEDYKAFYKSYKAEKLEWVAILDRMRNGFVLWTVQLVNHFEQNIFKGVSHYLRGVLSRSYESVKVR